MSSKQQATPTSPEPARDAELHRRRLRIGLTRARQGAGHTQKSAAQALEWSISKMVRIEQGGVPVHPNDVKLLLALYNVTDQAKIDELVSLARIARDAPGWGEYSFFSDAFREMLGQEAGATHIYKYEPSLVPGYFQTAEYTLRLLDALGVKKEEIGPRAEVRRLRQQIMEDLESPPELHFVVGEAALIRPIGSDDLMRDQIRRLIDVSKRPNVHLFLLPFAAGPHRGMGAPFTLLQFADLDDCLYLEDAQKRTSAKDDPETVARYIDIYNEIEDLAAKQGSFRDQANRIVDQRYPDES